MFPLKTKEDARRLVEEAEREIAAIKRALQLKATAAQPALVSLGVRPEDRATGATASHPSS